MLKFLLRPYPYLRNTKKSLITNFLIGSFIAFFLVVFKPFQIDLWITEYKTLKLVGFGFISFFIPAFISFLIEWFVPSKVLEDSWKIWHEMLSIILVLTGIAFANLIYGNYLHIMNFDLSGFFSAFLVVILIGIFPVVFYLLSNQNRFLRINLENASVINSQIEELQNKTEETKELKADEELVFISENEKERVTLKPFQLLYIESADNYSNIVFSDDGKQKKVLIRSSLKRMEAQINFSFIVRCHRTFIVNLKNVNHIEGNAAGYKIHLAQHETVIPVSRTYSNAVIEKLKEVK